jgi:hypothetical protein
MVIFILSLSNLNIPEGLKKYKSKTIELIISSDRYLWQLIDVITLLSVLIKKA